MGLFSKEPDISKFISERNVNGLIKALRNNDRDTQHLAAEALGDLGDRSAISHLLNTIKSSTDYKLCWIACKSCIELGCKREVIPILIDMLKHSFVRGSVLEHYRSDICSALQSITRQPFGERDLAAWSDWWNKQS